MSYDLTFIKYDKKPRMAVSKIYVALMDGKDVPGLEELPGDEIKRAILESFSEWKINGEKPLDLEKDDVSFQVEFESAYIRSDWYGRQFRVYATRLRQLLGTRFGLHMYDSQSDVLREVIGGKTALNRITEIRELFKQKFEGLGYKLNQRFGDFERETDDAVLTVQIDIYEQNKSDVVTVRPTFKMSYPKLDALANEIRGKEIPYYGATASFAITDASNKFIKDPFYTLKNGADSAVVAEQVWKDMEEYVFTLFAKADSIQKYENIFLDRNVKSVRPNVAYREYSLIAMALLNRGMIDDKTLTKLLAKAEKVDDGFDPACVDRIRRHMMKRFTK